MDSKQAFRDASIIILLVSLVIVATKTIEIKESRDNYETLFYSTLERLLQYEYKMEKLENGECGR